MMSAITFSYDTQSLTGKVFRLMDMVFITAVVLIFGYMVLIVSAQVALRYGLNMSIDWADETGRLAFVWVVFLSIWIKHTRRQTKLLKMNVDGCGCNAITLA